MYEVQEAFTFEWVTISTHDTWDDSADALQERLEAGVSEDRVRTVEVGN